MAVNWTKLGTATAAFGVAVSQDRKMKYEQERQARMDALAVARDKREAAKAGREQEKFDMEMDPTSELNVRAREQHNSMLDYRKALANQANREDEVITRARKVGEELYRQADEAAIDAAREKYQAMTPEDKQLFQQRVDQMLEFHEANPDQPGPKTRDEAELAIMASWGASDPEGPMLQRPEREPERFVGQGLMHSKTSRAGSPAFSGSTIVGTYEEAAKQAMEKAMLDPEFRKLSEEEKRIHIDQQAKWILQQSREQYLRINGPSANASPAGPPPQPGGNTAFDTIYGNSD